MSDVKLSAKLPICLFVCQSARLFKCVCLSVCLPVFLNYVFMRIYLCSVYLTEYSVCAYTVCFSLPGRWWCLWCEHTAIWLQLARQPDLEAFVPRHLPAKKFLIVYQVWAYPARAGRQEHDWQGPVGVWSLGLSVSGCPDCVQQARAGRIDSRTRQEPACGIQSVVEKYACLFSSLMNKI